MMTFDPDANLARQMVLASECQAIITNFLGYSLNQSARARLSVIAEELASLATEMDLWLSAFGRLPARWKRTQQ